jgi:hypothetical protein
MGYIILPWLLLVGLTLFCWVIKWWIFRTASTTGRDDNGEQTATINQTQPGKKSKSLGEHVRALVVAPFIIAEGILVLAAIVAIPLTALVLILWLVKTIWSYP